MATKFSHLWFAVAWCKGANVQLIDIFDKGDAFIVRHRYYYERISDRLFSNELLNLDTDEIINMGCSHSLDKDQIFWLGEARTVIGNVRGKYHWIKSFSGPICQNCGTVMDETICPRCGFVQK